MSFRFYETIGTVKERINFSRYSLIPVCNLEEDAYLYMIDIIYARNL